MHLSKPSSYKCDECEEEQPFGAPCACHREAETQDPSALTGLLGVPLDQRNGRPKILNEMKAELIGEFSVPVELTCHCGDAEDPEDCEYCGGSGEYTYHAVIPWTTQKEIYKRMAEVAAQHT